MYDDYNTKENHQFIPKQAFLYFPTGSSTQKQQDDYKLIIKNQVKRLIYEGGIEYLKEEMDKINDFKEYLKKNQVILDKRWSKTYIYKFLQSTGYNYKKTKQQILAHNEYKTKLNSINFDDLKHFAQPFLKQGPFYFNGRDSKYRPIIVCDILKVTQMKMTDQQIQKCLMYFFQFLYRNMFINGQVENVVGIMDLGFTSPMELVKPMKMTISFLQGNYKYKMHAIYILRPTGMFEFLYGFVKHLMKEDTQRKVNVIQKDQPITKLLESANRSQFEERFGGSHPNLKDGDYWPPRSFGDDFSNPLVKNNMVSEDQYRELYKSGQLKRRKVHLGMVEKVVEELNLQIEGCETKQPTSLRFSEAKDNKNKKDQNWLQRVMRRMKEQCCFGVEGTQPQTGRRSMKKQR